MPKLGFKLRAGLLSKPMMYDVLVSLSTQIFVVKKGLGGSQDSDRSGLIIGSTGPTI